MTSTSDIPDREEHASSPAALDHLDHLVALQSARRRLLQAIEDVDDAAFEQVVHGEWRVRDLLVHLASWDRMIERFVTDVSAGQRSFEVTASPDGDWSGWNGAQVEVGRERSVEARRTELDGARDGLYEALYRLDGSALDLEVLAPWGFVDTVLGHVVTQAVHDAQHTDEILRALGQGEWQSTQG